MITEETAERILNSDLQLRPLRISSDHPVSVPDWVRLSGVLEFCNMARPKNNWQDIAFRQHKATIAYLQERMLLPDAWGAIITTVPITIWTAGFVVGRSLRDRRGRIVTGSEDLVLLMVNPLFWRHGIGRQLLDWATDFNRERGVERLYLWVHEDNERARTLYEDTGYLRTGETKVREGVQMVQYCLALTPIQAA